jgi:predicted P-loop ATPase
VPDNVRIALAKLGITVRYDKFADRILLDGLKEFGPALDDAAVDRLWFVIDKRYHFQPSQNLLRTVLKDQAQLNGFHPVLDYLNSLKWDGVERIDKWLITYGDAEDTEYTRAVGALSLVAAVRRVRNPGCKFDEMLVIENEIQGTGKSTALAILAVKPDWFTDAMPLNASAQKTIETIRGKWIIEIAELRGYRAEIEQIKATLSR